MEKLPIKHLIRELAEETCATIQMLLEIGGLIL